MITDLPVNILVSIGSAVFGVLIGLLIDSVRTRIRFKQELKQNNQIDITGDDWYAAWQTSVNMQQIINTERLSVKQKGQTVKLRNFEKSPENPIGGYLWEGQMQFFYGKSLMGWYFPLKTENLTSKGIMFFSYQSAKKTFVGKWVGSAYDGELVSGFVVVSKDRQRSVDRLAEIIAKHPHEINIIYDAL